MAAVYRYSLLLVTAALLAVSLAVDFFFPAYGTLVTYLLLFWLIASFLLFRSFRPTGPASRPSSSPAAPANPATGAGAPLPSGPPVQLGFCAYCASPLPQGATSCPVCHRAVRAF